MTKYTVFGPLSELTPEQEELVRIIKERQLEAYISLMKEYEEEKQQ
jgi:hypothetical protein